MKSYIASLVAASTENYNQKPHNVVSYQYVIVYSELCWAPVAHRVQPFDVIDAECTVHIKNDTPHPTL